MKTRPSRNPKCTGTRLATGVGTLVFFMGMKNLQSIVDNLVAHGRSAETPVALIQWGTRTDQRVVTGTLERYHPQGQGSEARAARDHRRGRGRQASGKTQLVRVQAALRQAGCRDAFARPGERVCRAAHRPGRNDHRISDHRRGPACELGRTGQRDPGRSNPITG